MEDRVWWEGTFWGHVLVYYHDGGKDFLDVNTWKSTLTEFYTLIYACMFIVCQLYFIKIVKENCIKFNSLMWLCSSWFKCAFSVCS